MMATEVVRRRFSAADFEQMDAAGIFRPDERVELIAGEIIERAAIGIRHAQCANRLNRLLIRGVSDDVQVSPQNPVRIADDTEPIPDFVVQRNRPYDATPTARDVFFVIEVSDTTRNFDRGTRMPLYAAAGIPEAWLMDLVAERIERYTDPQDGQYRRVAFANRGESLASATIPTLIMDADAILGP
jgi:Uma2 family endonuclease